MEPLNQFAVGSFLNVAALIPAWQPDGRLPMLVRELSATGFSSILVIDDGSGPQFGPIFEEISSLPGVHLLRHPANLGKGRALKSGMHHFLAECPGVTGIVTADADGQHNTEDILHIARALSNSQGRVVIGTRAFRHDVPLRSKLGNTLTRYLFAFLTGTKLGDTQTGLRAFPRAMLPELLGLAGERYEYEMAVLAHICKAGNRPIEVPIETVYIDGNRSSHFDPIWDSMRIYFALVRSLSPSLLSARPAIGLRSADSGK